MEGGGRYLGVPGTYVIYHWIWLVVVDTYEMLGMINVVVSLVAAAAAGNC